MKYGFIGCGNMGGALARALAKETVDFMISDRSGRAKALASELGCAYGDARTVAANCDRIFLGVKPQMMEGVLASVRDVLRERKPTLITMAAGLAMEKIGAFAGGDLPVIRIMPNTPAAIGRGVTLYCANERVEEPVLQEFLADMAHSGGLYALDEKLMDAGSALSGCGPAFVYLFIEALADGAVSCGVPRAKALELAAATVAGAAEMVSVTGQHPGALKDAVCSPGGSTIEGVRALEANAFRGTVMDCVRAAYEKSKALGK